MAVCVLTERGEILRFPSVDDAKGCMEENCLPYVLFHNWPSEAEYFESLEELRYSPRADDEETDDTTPEGKFICQFAGGCNFCDKFEE
jgi:hypothetical protein